MDSHISRPLLTVPITEPLTQPVTGTWRRGALVPPGAPQIVAVTPVENPPAFRVTLVSGFGAPLDTEVGDFIEVGVAGPTVDQTYGPLTPQNIATGFVLVNSPMLSVETRIPHARVRRPAVPANLYSDWDQGAPYTVPAPIGPPTLAYHGTVTATSSGTDIIGFPSLEIGGAFATRRVIVACSNALAGNQQMIGAVINGVTAQLFNPSTIGNEQENVFALSGIVPTSTFATVTINTDVPSTGRWMAHVFTCDNAHLKNAAPTASKSGSDVSILSISDDVPTEAGGFMIAAACWNFSQFSGATCSGDESGYIQTDGNPAGFPHIAQCFYKNMVAATPANNVTIAWQTGSSAAIGLLSWR